MMDDRRWIDSAYKKLKGAVYFDKTQLRLIDKIVEFESEDLESSLSKAASVLSAQDEIWEDYVSDILEGMDVLVFPKKLKKPKDTQIVFNADDDPIELEKVQYFIDLPVLGQVLGVLWILTIGARLDSRADPEQMPMYEHSYGNRLRKNLFHPDNKDVSFSPYLFEPYFSQYQKWRDTALDYALKNLDDKQDAVILTLDLRSYFYGIHYSEQEFDLILQTVKSEDSKEHPELPFWAERVHSFVYQVLKTYSDKVRTINADLELDLENRVFLPIGFLPSNILSNWFLTPFDEAISELINPVYYGRYVDDIIIVDKVEKNSWLRKKAQSKPSGSSSSGQKLTAKDVIEYYFLRKSTKPSQEEEDAGPEQPLFVELDYSEMTPDQKKAFEKAAKKQEEQSDSEKGQPYLVYRIHPEHLKKDRSCPDKPDIQVQNDKVKVFYFREGATRALIDCFRTQIGSNASEFRFLPDMEMLLERNNYSEIFKLENSETPNKLRGVTNVSLDRFAVSKFLGKYRKAGSLIHDKKETAFDKDLLTIFSKRVLIEHYILWERLLEIMVVNARYDGYERIAVNILEAIEELCPPYKLLAKSEVERVKRTLFSTFQAALYRTSALCHGPKIEKILQKIQEKEKQHSFAESGMRQELAARRANFRSSYMLNKYVLPLPIDCAELTDETDGDINLCNFREFFQCFQMLPENPGVKYYPYMVTPQEISFVLACERIKNGADLYDPKEQIDKIKSLYSSLNFPAFSSEVKVDALPDCVKFGSEGQASVQSFAISVGGEKTGKIKLAVGNARMQARDYKQALLGKPRLSYERYQQIALLLRAALSEKVDILVLPECFIPWEWIPQIARICANNDMALVTGVEPVLSGELVCGGKSSKKVYNLTAVILPYKKDDNKFSHVVFHHKVHYSPEEKREILGYRLLPIEGKNYQLFYWKDLWFSVYCCFELASIKDRAIFQSYADLAIAVEWNKDVGYFGNIIESMSRDLHCYCVQANSSDYGDSRVVLPTSANRRDLIKTKGGQNCTILTDVIDVDALRDFQRKEYELQRDDKRFKPTPPYFNFNVVERKQDRTLWGMLNQKKADDLTFSENDT